MEALLIDLQARLTRKQLQNSSVPPSLSTRSTRPPAHPSSSPSPRLLHPLLKMPYALCILGCGTMGISVLSGVLDNLASPLLTNANDEESAPSTPMGSMILEDKVDSVPDRCVLCGGWVGGS